MRLYRVIMCSGANMDIMAKVILDDKSISDDVSFYQDETRHHLVATIKRDQIAGMILYPQKSSTIPLHRKTAP
jgi:hypothetical protein